MSKQKQNDNQAPEANDLMNRVNETNTKITEAASNVGGFMGFNKPRKSKPPKNKKDGK